MKVIRITNNAPNKTYTLKANGLDPTVTSPRLLQFYPKSRRHRTASRPGNRKPLDWHPSSLRYQPLASQGSVTPVAMARPPWRKASASVPIGPRIAVLH